MAPSNGVVHFGHAIQSLGAGAAGGVELGGGNEGAGELGKGAGTGGASSSFFFLNSGNGPPATPPGMSGRAV